MAVNFTNPAFGTTVATSSISADGYEPQNLLKPGTFGQWKGFLAEHFIKPPLNVIFSIPFQIDIHSIVIDPHVGSQKSSGIEIFSSTVPQEQGGNEELDAADSNRVSTRNSVAQLQSSRPGENVVSTVIGKAYSNDGSPRFIQFVNRRYRPHFKELAPLPPDLEGMEGVVKRDFRCPFASCVNNLNQIIVRITRVQGGSLPALKKVEIWGQPSPACGKEVVLKVLQTAQHMKGLNTTRSSQPLKQNDTRRSCSSAAGKESALHSLGIGARGIKQTTSDLTAQCPEEFIDPITCEIMVIPILLPSGHTIDQQTLEKHNRIEATWGRPQNDPFTAVPFSSASKLIPNVKLKARLDRFLLTGGTAFKGVPRTTGSATHEASEVHSKQRMQTSLLLQQGRSEQDDGGQPSSQVDQINEESGNPTKRHRGHRPRSKRKVSEMIESSHNQQYSAVSAKKSIPCGPSDIENTKISTCSNGNNQSEPVDPASHEKLVADSLNDALALTLASLPSYARTSSAKSDVKCEDLVNACINCQTPTHSNSDLRIYSMPCGHLICRKCTASMTTMILCRHCTKSFKRTDISRVHSR